jgi:hypothetical protein
MRLSIIALLFMGGCSGGSTSPDMRVHDAGPWQPNVTGRWASEMRFHFQAADGGASVAPFPLLAIFTSNQKASGEVDSKWELCAFPIPGLGMLTDDFLSPAMISVSNGMESGSGDGAHYLQPPLAFVVGAQLANPDGDPLPLDASKPCADATSTGCVPFDPSTGKPVVTIATSGLQPDADLVYVVARVRFGFDAVLHEYGVLGGTVDPATIEWHVIGCHLRAGMDCAAGDVAQIEAARPALALEQGTMSWSFQGAYITCPTFEGDPDGQIAGTDTGTDGGAAADGGVIVGPVTFSQDVQGDLDSMGCATGGCHETRTAPGQMHLYYHPSTADRLRANYDAVLPWTTGAVPGGRFVNEVSLSPSMRERWLYWISSGTPF